MSRSTVAFFSRMPLTAGMAEISRRVARAHPAFLTALFVAGLVMQMVLSGTTAPPPVRGLVTVLPIAAACLWYWSVFVVSKTAKSRAPMPPWTWLFAVPPIIPLVAVLAGWWMNNSPVALVFFVVFFTVLWFAAQALESADALTRHASAGRMAVTMVLMFCALIGVWILGPKIRRVAGMSAI